MSKTVFIRANLEIPASRNRSFGCLPIALPPRIIRLTISFEVYLDGHRNHVYVFTAEVSDLDDHNRDYLLREKPWKVDVDVYAPPDYQWGYLPGENGWNVHVEDPMGILAWLGEEFFKFYQEVGPRQKQLPA